MAEANAEFGTVLGPDCKLKGDLVFESAAKVLGRVEGSISSKGKLFIADGATCKATVTAKEVSVEGHIEGNVEASERIEVKPNGRITGDIVASRMVMAEGASIDGHIRIGSNGETTPKARSAAEVKPKAASTTAAPAAEPATAGARSK